MSMPNMRTSSRTRSAYSCAALVALSVSMARGQEITSGRALLADDFDRFTAATTQIGAVETGGKSWGKRLGVEGGQPIASLVRGVEGSLWIGYSSGHAPHDCGVYVADFTVADAVIRLTVGPSTMKGRNHTAAISYRAQGPQSAAGGWQPDAYHVELSADWSGSRDVLLRYGRQRLAAGDVANRRTPADRHRVTIAFHGYHHQVWIDDRPVIDYWEIATGRNAAGHVGFGGYYSQGTFDDFRVSAAVSDATAPHIDTSAGRIAPLIYQGRPFFVLGTFDAPGGEDLAEWQEAGGNTVIVGVMSETLPAAQRREHLEGLAAWAVEHDVAMVYYPLIPLFSKEGERTIPTRPEEIPAKVEQLGAMLAVTAGHPQTLGYWTFDEIENHLYKAYAKWEQKKDKGLAKWIAEGMKWTYEALKAGDPDAYVMPTIAWWTTYEDLAPLYDVNVPNTYAVAAKYKPMDAPLYNVVYDAARAADAIRASGRTSFVFMPGIFDIVWKGGRSATGRELRYCFFAPLTQGAMGLLPWRLGRCTLAYRRAVVYPVMREVKRLIPWLVGEWHDEKVASTRDTATAEYLQEFPERIRLVPGENDAEKIRVPVTAVPDCSHMLRRRPDNTYLLLAVNNLKAPLPVTFTIRDIPGLPDEAKEMIDWRPVPIDNGKISDVIEPFGVRAYVIVPR